jgi:hypothetical protein
VSDFPPQVIEEILQSYRRLRSPYKVARECGYTPRMVWEVLDKYQDTITLPRERFGGEGRPEIQKWLVARIKPSPAGWDNDDPKIKEARQRVVDGTHTMATGRDGAWLLLYSIPLAQPGGVQPDVFKIRSY